MPEKEMSGVGILQNPHNKTNKQTKTPNLILGSFPPGRILGVVSHWHLTENEDWSQIKISSCNLPSTFPNRLSFHPWDHSTGGDYDHLPGTIFPNPCFGFAPLITQGPTQMSPPKRGHPDKLIQYICPSLATHHSLHFLSGSYDHQKLCSCGLLCMSP